MRYVGTVVRGIRTPIIKENDDLASIVVDSLMNAKEAEGFEFKDKDIVAITEAVVGISEGNYVTVDDVAKDVQNKFPSKNIGVVNPILSRNRFSIVWTRLLSKHHSPLMKWETAFWMKLF